MNLHELGDIDPTTMADGKRRLVLAALRLAGRKGDISELGVRELGREALLNPNTFYRHFKSIEDLALVTLASVTGELRGGLAEARRAADASSDVTRTSATYFFDFVAKHPNAFIAGLRMINGTSMVIRKAMDSVLDDMAAEMADDIRELQLAKLSDESLLNVCRIIVRQLFFKSLNYIECPEQRPGIIDETVTFSRMMFLGASALQEQQAGRA